MKNNNLSKILTIVAAVIAIIGIVLFVRVPGAGDDAIKGSADLQNSIVSPLVSYSFWLLIITAVVAVVLSIFGLLKNPAALKKALISLVGLAVVVLLAYLLADGGAVKNGLGEIIKNGEAGSTSKLVSTGIYASFILGTVGLVFFLYDLIKGLIR